MRIFKNILATILFSKTLLGSGLSPLDMEKSSSQKSKNSPLIKFQIDDYIPDNVITYLTGEDVQSWIKAFASLDTGTSDRRAFIKSRNIKFFGYLYPRANITRESPVVLDLLFPMCYLVIKKG